VGFLESLFGGGRQLKAPAPDRLFAMTTAQVMLETELRLRHRGSAGIVFQPLSTADFQSLVREAEELLTSAAEDTGSTVESADDSYGYRWIKVRDQDFEDLVVSLNLISGQLQSGGYGDRLLACVFPFAEEGAARAIYFIYNFKRGKFYPFVPGAGPQSRDTEAELRLKAQVGAELPIEPEMTRWFPLWDVPL
jgi:PspA associated protein B